MLYLYTGTDRMKTRTAMNTAIAVIENTTSSLVDRPIIRITDVHTLDDLDAVLAGGGMFASVRVVVLDGIFDREEMRERMIGNIANIAKSADHFFIYTEKLDATTRKQIEKHATNSQQFDVPKKAEKASTIFTLGNSLRAHKRKDLWVGYQRELALNTSPEAIHGVLFWAVKQWLLSARTDTEEKHSKKLIAILSALPHEARRHGIELEYALERFVLSSDVVS